mmetsp:Transcript_14348/g.16584  ORF Transcript_14348/g.16584 Transcript_14348/m.16584 type:complete len:130 (+) Transcript_14348:140-529(+)
MLLNITSLILHFHLENPRFEFSVPQILFCIAMLAIGAITLWKNNRSGCVVYIILSLCLSVLLIFFECIYHRSLYEERSSSIKSYFLNSLYLGNNIVLIVLSGFSCVHFYGCINAIVRLTEAEFQSSHSK